MYIILYRPSANSHQGGWEGLYWRFVSGDSDVPELIPGVDSLWTGLRAE